MPTAKNAQVKDFWEKVGFTCIAEKEDGAKNYTLALKAADTEIEDYYHITVK